MKIILSPEEMTLVADSGFKQFNDIAVLAFRKAFSLEINTNRLFLGKKTVCLKTQPSSNSYPELKEKVGANTADIYVLVTVNPKEGSAWLEGWTERDVFVQDKNLNLSREAYYMCYKDLKNINELTW